MLLHTEPVQSGLALAHRVRVTLRTAVAIAALLGSTTVAAQTPGGATTPAGAQTVAAPPFGGRGDTVLMKQVEVERGWFEKVTTVAGGLMTISILVLTAALVPAAWNFRKNHKMLRDMIEKLQGDIAPLMQHASAIADDVNYISTSIRVDVQQVNQTVATVNRRLLSAVNQTEDRVNEFNALLSVAQEEAESAFISTASTLRGIGSGAAALARDGRRRGRKRDRELRRRMEQLRQAIDEDLHEAVENVGPALENSFAEEETTDGDNGNGRGAADSGREAPRIRPRGERPGPRSGSGA